MLEKGVEVYDSGPTGTFAMRIKVRTYCGN